MFAWLPFLAADLGSVASGYLTKLYVRWFGLTRVLATLPRSAARNGSQANITICFRSMPRSFAR
jgi:hypothetical protein